MQAPGKAVAAFFLALALIGAGGLLASRSAAAADEKKKDTVSRELAKPLKAAQDDIQAKKYSDALAKIKEADGNPKKTPFDEHVINQLAGFAYAKTNNYPEAAKAFEAQINDGFTSPEEVERLTKAVAQIYYQLKSYDKAIEYGNRLIKSGQADDEMYTLVGQSYYLKNDYKGTLKFEDNFVDAQIKKGQQPKKEPLELALSSCVKMNDSDCTSHELERLVAYYPKPEYWAQLLDTLLRSPQKNDKVQLQVYRLMSEVDVLKEPGDFTDMAQIALDQGSPGEAQHTLEKAFQKNVFPDKRTQDKNQRLLESAKKAAANDLATLPKAAKDAESAPTGDKEVGVGLAYLGYQQYDKAVDALSKGIAKGGLKSEPEARLLLGIAQLKAGHKDDAVKAFHAVKGDPTLERLATLWTLHAKQA
ncbi:MAG TPA: tetratricopeptide repeat protein [Steroidobacteraceae bacterium]|nr:tetratricopeptide repeat protein [Steroidobacteraceae bacterium]